MDMYCTSPAPMIASPSSTPLSSSTFRQCSIPGCSSPLSDESPNRMCESCRSRHRVYATAKRARKKAVLSEPVVSMTVDNWLDLNSDPILQDAQSCASTSGSVREPPAAGSAALPLTQSQPPPTSNWTQSINPWLFSTPVHSSVTQTSSELANALVMPSSQGNHGHSPNLPRQTASGSSLSQSVACSSDRSNVEATKEIEGTDEHTPEDSHGQIRVCSVRGCKQTVSDDYEYKMCPACRVRYQKYGTTKRAKWKAVREKKKQAANEDCGSPDAPNLLSDVVEDGSKQNTPLPQVDMTGSWQPKPAGTDTTSVSERDPVATTAQRPQPDESSISDVQPSVVSQSQPQVLHQRPTFSTSLNPSSLTSTSKVAFIHEQLPRPPSAPSATGYLESDPIINGFSKFRVELFEGELDGRHAEGTVMSGSNVMTLGVPPRIDKRTGTDPEEPSSVSFEGIAEMSSAGEDPLKKANDQDSSRDSFTNTITTTPTVPVSISVGQHITSHSERQATACTTSQEQNNIESQAAKDGPSSRPLPTTPKPKGKRSSGSKAKVAATTSTATSRTTSRPAKSLAPVPPQNAAAVSHLQPGYPTPHPYLYPYYPMYFPGYSSAYQYPYLPMPFPAPPSSPPKTKKKKKPAQAVDVAKSMRTPLPPPPPAFTYPYPPGHSNQWTYPHLPPPPPQPSQSTISLPQGSTSVGPPPPPHSPPGSAVYPMPQSYPFYPPSQGPPASTPPAPYPHFSGAQPYSGTPLTTVSHVPPFSVGTDATTVSSASGGGSSKNKGKEVEKDGGGTHGKIGGKDSSQLSVQKPPHVQMQFNYYHYGLGTSQSPTTPEAARRKRRKVDPNYREKLEMYRAQAKAAAATPPDDSASPPPVPTQGDAQLDLNVPRHSFTEIDSDANSEFSQPALRQCSNKGCKRLLPVDGDNRTICKKCKTKFKKMTERTKQRFKLVPKRTVFDALGK